MRFLVLGGTQEALGAASALVERGHDVTTALAGATRHPASPAGRLITGGFGGPDGLSRYLDDNRIDYLIDATHPFAAKMSAGAVVSAQKSRVPLIRLIRPPFVEPAGANWWRVDSKAQAAACLPAGAKVFLTIGRLALEPFIERRDVRFILRSIEAPQTGLPDNFVTLQQRPPFEKGEELALMRRRGITHLVSKDSGGEQTVAKLDAAFMLRVQVIMISRPPLPPAREVTSVGELLAVLDHAPSPERRPFFLPWLRRRWTKSGS